MLVVDKHLSLCIPGSAHWRNAPMHASVCMGLGPDAVLSFKTKPKWLSTACEQAWECLSTSTTTTSVLNKHMMCMGDLSVKDWDTIVKSVTSLVPTFRSSASIHDAVQKASQKSAYHDLVKVLGNHYIKKDVIFAFIWVSTSVSVAPCRDYAARVSRALQKAGELAPYLTPVPNHTLYAFALWTGCRELDWDNQQGALLTPAEWAVLSPHIDVCRATMLSNVPGLKEDNKPSTSKQGGNKTGDYADGEEWTDKKGFTLKYNAKTKKWSTISKPGGDRNRDKRGGGGRGDRRGGGNNRSRSRNKFHRDDNRGRVGNNRTINRALWGAYRKMEEAFKNCEYELSAVTTPHAAVRLRKDKNGTSCCVYHMAKNLSKLDNFSSVKFDCPYVDPPCRWDHTTRIDSTVGVTPPGINWKDIADEL